MKVLFIGGTGTISRAAAELCLARGMDLWLLVRGTRDRRLPRGATVVHGDIRRDPAAAAWLKGHRWDCVVDWVVYDEADARRDVRLFGRTSGRFVYVSSASVYRKPPARPLVDETAAIGNPLWDYADRKAACERLFLAERRRSGFPVVVVRPGHVYSEFVSPTGFAGLGHGVIERILAGRPIVVHGDGLGWWSVMTSEDFARRFTPLLTLPGVEGEAFHITSEEWLTWAGLYETMGRVLRRRPRLVQVPSEAIARFDAELGRSLLGDKAHSILFDNAKIRARVPRAGPCVPFEEGFRRCAAWHRRHRSEVVFDRRRSRLMDDIAQWYNGAKPEAGAPAGSRSGLLRR